MDAASSIRPAGRAVELFNENVFSELRSRAGIPDDFLNTGWDFANFQHGGGKGGSMMAFVEDKFIVKELSAGDHKPLLSLAPSYGDHVRTGDTLLSPIYLHFRDMASDRYLFAMRNSIGKSPFKACYDLKGCADDKLIEKEGERIKAVHKRIWKIGMWCGQVNWTDERKRYYAGKVEARRIQVELQPQQRSSFISLLKRDTDFLAGHNLMDYSLLIATKEIPCGEESPSPSALKPYRCAGPNGKDLLVYMSLIDFLQVWTTGKRVARCIKVCECNKATIPPKAYANRMLTHFTHQVVEAQDGSAADPEDVDFAVDSLVPEKLISPPLPTHYSNTLTASRTSDALA